MTEKSRMSEGLQPIITGDELAQFLTRGDEWFFGPGGYKPDLDPDMMTGDGDGI